MAEQLNLQVNVTGNAAESVGSLKKQLKEATAQVAILSDKFGATSQEAVVAAKRAAELRDRIGDAKALTDAFNPDAKFKALSSSLSGVASGYSALQGAIGLFGQENKNLEKQLLRVQSALAFSQGLQGLFESIDSFKNLATVIKTQVVTAFQTLRGAIAATGLLALTIAIPLIIQNFDKLKAALYKLIPGLKTVGDYLGKVIDKVSDFLGFNEEEKKQAEVNRIKLVEAEKKKNKELEEERKRAAEKRAREIEEERKKEAARIAARDKLEQENKIRLINIRKEENDERLRKIAEEDKQQKKTEINNETAIQGIANRAKATAAAVQSDVNYLNWKAEYERKLDEDNKKLRQQKFESEVSMAQETLSIIGGLVDQNSAAGKAIAIAQAIINTYQGASKAIAQGGIFGPVAAAASIAAGFIQVKKIISTKIPSSKGSGSVGATSAPSMSGSASPITPSTEIMPRTSLNQETINAIGNQAIRAYVVETDISSNQKRIEAIKQKAKFG